MVNAPVFGSILVVCTGNICRSPIAENLLRMHVRDIIARSAGIAAVIGSEMDPVSRAVAASHGLECQPHVARQLSRDMCGEADLILVMDHYHREAVSAMSPHSRGKIFLLGRFLDDAEIPDPFQKSHEVYESVHCMLEKATRSWAAKLAV